MARMAQPIKASEEDHQELLLMSRSLKIGKRYGQRAEVVLLSLEGKNIDEIIAAQV